MRDRWTKAALGVGALLLVALLSAFLLQGEERGLGEGSDEAGWGLAQSSAPAPRARAEAPDAQPTEGGVAALASEGEGAAPASESATGGRYTKGRERRRGPPYLLEGVVSDPAGLPVPGALVTALERGMQRPQAVVCDALGRFSLRLEGSRVWLRPAPPEGAPGLRRTEGLAWERPGELLRYELPLPLQLARGVALAGVVRDAAGRAIPSPRLVAIPVPSRGGGGELRAAGDARGAYRFEGLKPGRYLVYARASGYLEEQTRTIVGEEGARLDLAIELAARVRGVLRGADGQPLAQASIFAYREGKRLETATCDEAGVFSFDELPSGPLELFARSRDRHQSAREELSVVAGQTAELSLVLSPAPSLSGTLRSPEGAPLGGWELEARSASGEVRRQAKSDAEGRFRVGDLYPGRYELAARPPRAVADLVRVEVEVTSGELRRDLSAPPGATLAGRVVDAQGEPLEGSAVFAVREGRTEGTSGTSSAGAFELSDLPAGDYRVFVRYRSPNQRDQAGTLLTSVGVGERRAGLTLRLAPAAELRGRVTGPSGQALGAVRLEVRGLDSPVTREAQSDAQGRFKIGPLYTGSYEVWVAAAALDYLAQELGVAGLAAEPQTFRVEGGQDVELALRLRLR